MKRLAALPEASPVYTKYFRNIVPIFSHHAFTEAVEFSDKIILPKSVYYDLLRAGLPLPPLFKLLPERQAGVPVYCAALEFTAEEGFIYLPIRMFVALGYRVVNTDMSSKREFKLGSGLTLTTLPTTIPDPLFKLRYALPICTHLSVHVSSPVPESSIREGLLNYTILEQGSKIPIAFEKESVVLTFVEVGPELVASLGSSGYHLVIVKDLPVQPKAFVVEQNDPEKPRLFDIPNAYTERVPKYLANILHSPRRVKEVNELPTHKSRSILKAVFNNQPQASKMANRSVQLPRTSKLPTVTPKPQHLHLSFDQSTERPYQLRSSTNKQIFKHWSKARSPQNLQSKQSNKQYGLKGPLLPELNKCSRIFIF